MSTLFERNHFIQNDRIILRPVTIEDAYELINLFDEPLTVQQAEHMAADFGGAYARKEELVLGIIDKQDLRIKGIIEIYMAEQDNTCMLGYSVIPQYRNMKYAKDAVYLLNRYLCEECEIQIIRAIVEEDNLYSIKVLSHNGYEMIHSNGKERIYEYHRKEKSSAFQKTVGKDKMICLAGGCFWGTEKAFSLLDGVTHTETGYANGLIEDQHYEDVCRDDTGYKEAVMVSYDPQVVTLETIMKAYFLCVDPTVKNRQGNDIGSQYQTGVYYLDEADESLLNQIFAEEKRKYDAFYVELEPLRNFWKAEEYHQKYLDKNPNGYCHITRVEMEEIKELNRKNV